jgi:hypothetical protein
VSESVEALVERVRAALEQGAGDDEALSGHGEQRMARTRGEAASAAFDALLARLYSEEDHVEVLKARLAEAEKDRDRYRKAYENAAAAVDALAALDPEQP